jgi:large subunit ribosomal protein L21
MDYAIIEVSGKQLWVEPKKFYLVDNLPLKVGTKVYLKKILLVNKANKLECGLPYLPNVKILARIVKHCSGKKTIVYKMKPKKKYRKKIGFRPKFTRLRIETIEILT